MFNRQQRMWIFMVLILGDCCRIIRFDRAGAVATQKFNYKTNGATLIEFFWRYAKWSASTRGHDPTAERIPPGSALAEQMQARVKKDKVMTERKDYACRLFEESLDMRWYWWKLRVEPDGKEGEDQFFVIGKPNFQAPGVVGRGTRGYVALPADNIADGKFCYLKDAWRVVGPDIDKEGTILEHLNKHNVMYIPTLACHGDVGDPIQQVTHTDALWEELNRRNEIEEGKVGEDIVSPLKKHRHYRIAVKQVGLQMSEFANSRELIKALGCCILAHKKAYEIGVIHRDISAGNVLLYYDAYAEKPLWCGLLNDWELSNKTDSAYPFGRQLDRTGTWQFMSAMTLTTPGELVRVEDELESFFNVLLYFAIRFLHHNCKRVGDFMYAYFDDYSTLDDNYGCGIYKKYCMETGRILLHHTTGSKGGPKDGATISRRKHLEVLTFGWPTPSDPPKPHPLNHIIATILEWTSARYTLAFAGETKLKGDIASVPSPDDSESDSDSSDMDFVIPGYTSTNPSGSTPTAALRASPEALAKRNAELQAAAQQLHGHTAILNIFLEAGQGAHGAWPKDDRTPDQLPKGYQHGEDLTITYPNPPNVSGTMLHGANPSSTASSRKRFAAEVEELEVAGTSKRAK
ncbi:hypothetical protein C2E23DRAFT_812769 [Lenzites betulinus]|nr:hypothetical protein C2E23DRAFT_812769 [Lenzites betulinus]